MNPKKANGPTENGMGIPKLVREADIGEMDFFAKYLGKIHKGEVDLGGSDFKIGEMVVTRRIWVAPNVQSSKTRLVHAYLLRYVIYYAKQDLFTVYYADIYTEQVEYMRDLCVTDSHGR